MWSKLKRYFGKKPEAPVRYVLKRQNPDGRGMVKVADLAEPVPIEELYPHLEPGVYALHKYKEGVSGFEVVWGPVEVMGEKEEAPEPKSKTVKPANPLQALTEYVTALKDFRDQLHEAYNIIGEVVGKPSEETIIETMQNLRKKYDQLAEIFGSKTSSGATIPVEGKLPAWFVYMPNLTDEVMNTVEKRLARWGVIESSEKTSGERILNLPKKPGGGVEPKGEQ
jgi:hypothetical protein